MGVRTRRHGRGHRVFGLTLEADVAWPGWPPLCDREPVDARLEHVSRAALVACWSEEDVALWSTEDDASGPTTVLRGTDGDHLVTRDDAEALWISPAADLVLCATPDPDDPAWARFVLDTGLLVLALLRGADPLHAAGVAFDEGCLALLGGTGAGKTSLAAELVANGGRLVCDDVLVPAAGEAGVVAHAAPPAMNVRLAWPGDRAALGRELARFGDEAWLAVEPAPREVPLRALVFLERAPGAALALEPRPATVVDLLDHGIGFDFSAARQRARFELLSEVAATVPAWTLAADSTAPAAQLAPLLRPAALTARAPA